MRIDFERHPFLETCVTDTYLLIFISRCIPFVFTAGTAYDLSTFPTVVLSPYEVEGISADIALSSQMVGLPISSHGMRMMRLLRLQLPSVVV